jgi:RNA polymerase sigma-70 factor (ECF subfamily)
VPLDRQGNPPQPPTTGNAPEVPCFQAVHEVIQRARAGDADALGALWRAYHHLVLRYLRGRATPDPDDVATAVWIDVARSISRFDGDAEDFRRWLFTIAARRRVDALRRTVRRAAADARFAGRADPAPTDPADEAQRAAGVERVLRLVGRLPDDQAEAVLLRVLGDLSVTDVAAIMGRREGHVRVLVHRGLTKLSELAVTERSAPAMER